MPITVKQLGNEGKMSQDICKYLCICICTCMCVLVGINVCTIRVRLQNMVSVWYLVSRLLIVERKNSIHNYNKDNKNNKDINNMCLQNEISYFAVDNKKNVCMSCNWCDSAAPID